MYKENNLCKFNLTRKKKILIFFLLLTSIWLNLSLILTVCQRVWGYFILKVSVVTSEILETFIWCQVLLSNRNNSGINQIRIYMES